MKSLLIITAALLAPHDASNLPPGAELFTPSLLSEPMKVEISNYKFSISEGDDGTLVSGYSFGRKLIEHNVPGAELGRAERLFAVESHGCDGSSIDLVVQLGPGNNADVERRSYYRLAFSPDLSSVIAEFHDPSVSAVNAILPIQSVEGVPDPETGAKVLCDGPIPSVSAQAER